MGRDSRYHATIQKTSSESTLRIKRSQIRDSNERLRTLQELDMRQEEQLRKDFAALEVRKKQQETETQRRINAKKSRLAETGYLSAGPGMLMLAPGRRTLLLRDCGMRRGSGQSEQLRKGASAEKTTPTGVMHKGRAIEFDELEV